MQLRKGIEENLPYSISRDTDIPAFYGDWLLEQFKQGWVLGAKPGEYVPAAWSLAPADVHSIIWWSRNYQALLDNWSVFKPYRQVFNMTILGYDPDTNRNKMPCLATQLSQASDLIALTGKPELFKWRYSPIPRDFDRDQERYFAEIAQTLGGLGVKECFASFMHENKRVKDTRDDGQRRAILSNMAALTDKYGIDLKVCWDDKRHIGFVHSLSEAKCIDGDELAATFGVGKPAFEGSCACALTINFGSHLQMPCKMGCKYCYASDFYIEKKTNQAAV